MSSVAVFSSFPFHSERFDCAEAGGNKLADTHRKWTRINSTPQKPCMSRHAVVGHAVWATTLRLPTAAGLEGLHGGGGQAPTLWASPSCTPCGPHMLTPPPPPLARLRPWPPQTPTSWAHHPPPLHLFSIFCIFRSFSICTRLLASMAAGGIHPLGSMDSTCTSRSPPAAGVAMYPNP